MPTPPEPASAKVGTERVSAASLLGLAVLVGVVSVASGGWVRYQKASVGEEVAALAQPGDIQMLSSATCAPCLLARQWLNQHRVPFQECVIENDANCRQAFDALMAPGTPVVQVRGQTQLGFSPQRVRDALRRRAAS